MKRVIHLYTSTRKRFHNFLTSHKYAPLVEGVSFVFTGAGMVFVFVFLAMQVGLFNVKGSISDRNAFFTKYSLDKKASEQLIARLVEETDTHLASVRSKILPEIDFSWLQSAEWQTLKGALLKDREVIQKAAEDAGVSSRVLVSVVIAEQLRFFTSDRESFKQFFEPLKILGTLSQFSLGVSGVKPETAELVEKNLLNVNSDFYINDPKIKNLLNLTPAEVQKYGTSDLSAARFDRLTDSKNHYYSYLYTALFIRQINEQWTKKGFDISNRPEILATLFNLGFDKSVPKSDPQVAGSKITIEGKEYTFGELAFAFYYSGDLISVFGY